MKQTALLIEDDPDTQNIVGYWLSSAGFEFVSAGDGATGLRLVEDSPPDILILDLSLPDMDGTEVCRNVREYLDIPIVMLTGRQSENDCLRGFGLGIDDFVGKPFRPKELVARVKAIMRRTRPDILEEHRNGSHSFLQFGDLTMDVSKFQVSVAGQDVPLTRTEFQLLALLIREPGRLVSRDEAMTAVYGKTYDRDIRTVDSHVSHLRRKLQSAAPEGPKIQNVYGLGYRALE